MNVTKSKTNHTTRNQTRSEKLATNSAINALVPAELAVRRIAENEGFARGFDPKNFRLEISEDRNAYSVVFVPKARMRGGGLRVGIGKRDLKVKQVVYLQ